MGEPIYQLVAGIDSAQNERARDTLANEAKGADPISSMVSYLSKRIFQ